MDKALYSVSSTTMYTYLNFVNWIKSKIIQNNFRTPFTPDSYNDNKFLYL